MKTPPKKLDKMSLESTLHSLKGYLSDWCLCGPEPLQEILTLDNWKHFADIERERRQLRFLRLLEDDTLTAISNGQINFNETVQEFMDDEVLDIHPTIE